MASFPLTGFAPIASGNIAAVGNNRRVRSICNLLILAFLSLSPRILSAQEAQIIVHADQLGPRLSRYLTGACIEDVNHEIYGGLYSQMIFGESFQEPELTPPLKDFRTFVGRSLVRNGDLWAEGGDGPKLISDE